MAFDGSSPFFSAAAGTLFDNPTDDDEKAVQVLYETKQRVGSRRDVVNDPFMDPPKEMTKKVFFCRKTATFWELHRPGLYAGNHKTKAGVWHLQGAYGIRSSIRGGYVAIKRCYAYHEGGHKTNRIMNVYSLIYENSYIKTDHIELCHVFQSDNYNPHPKRIPDYFGFRERELSSLAEKLEAMQNKPNVYKDIAEFDPSTVITNGSRGKKAKVWEDFTEIKVLGPDGVKVATLAICHTCSMVYQTGALQEDKKEKGKYNFNSYGTQSLNKHKCSGQ